nr:hypothetical protein [Candidatus Microthrix sp.]
MNASSDPASTEPSSTVWPTLIYDDAPAAIEFLLAVGFTKSIVVPNEHDETVVEHSQLRWPEGSGVMLGTANREANEFSQRPTGCGAVYVVTADPDAAFDRALAAGATRSNDGGPGLRGSGAARWPTPRATSGASATIGASSERSARTFDRADQFAQIGAMPPGAGRPSFLGGGEAVPVDEART